MLRPERTAVLEALTTPAVDVAVKFADAAARLLEGEQLPPVAAAQRALKIVRVHRSPLTASRTGAADLLGAGGALLADERYAPKGRSTPPAQGAAILEHQVDVRTRGRCAGPLRQGPV